MKNPDVSMTRSEERAFDEVLAALRRQPSHVCFGNPGNECRVCGQTYQYPARVIEISSRRKAAMTAVAA